MASKKTKNLAVTEKEDQDESGEAKTAGGSLETIVKRLLKKGKAAGFLTYDEINKSLPAKEFSSEQIEDAMATFSDIGVQLVESEDDFEEKEPDS